MECAYCGHSKKKHSDAHCNGIVHLTPWDSESCACTEFKEK